VEDGYLVTFLKISPWSRSDGPKTLIVDYQGIFNEDIKAAKTLILSIALS
jgi:hypothetical protein